MARIAVVDDNQDTLELLVLALDHTHSVVSFDSPVRFSSEFKAGAYQLIIVDMVMPEMDGFEVLRRIRAKDANVPVIAFSARAFPDDQQKAIAAGFCDYFVKPIMDIERFRVSVISHVDNCARK